MKLTDLYSTLDFCPRPARRDTNEQLPDFSAVSEVVSPVVESAFVFSQADLDINVGSRSAPQHFSGDGGYSGILDRAENMISLEQMLMIENASLAFAEKSEHGVSSDAPSREWGFVPLEIGDRTYLEGQLRAFACVVAPEDLVISLVGSFDEEDLNSIDGDGWWLNLPWLSIAKALHVQECMFVAQGWQFHILHVS